MTPDAAPLQIGALRRVGAGSALAAIAVVSASIFAFLIWLVYFNRASGNASPVVASLPILNAVFNAISAVLLVMAYVAVRRRQFVRHMRLVFAALGSSTLFLVSYVAYHFIHGDTKFLARGAVRPVYFFVLVSHVMLSFALVPMIAASLYLSLSGRLAAHRKLSRLTLPVWLYVSVTGVLIVVLLKAFNP